MREKKRTLKISSKLSNKKKIKIFRTFGPVNCVFMCCHLRSLHSPRLTSEDFPRHPKSPFQAVVRAPLLFSLVLVPAASLCRDGQPCKIGQNLHPFRSQCWLQQQALTNACVMCNLNGLMSNNPCFSVVEHYQVYFSFK